MEEWKLVEKNRQTVWEVSSEGRIRKNSLVVPPRKGLAFGRYVRFKRNSLLHRVVAEAFIPNPNNLPLVNHIDGDRQNNKVSNLEWVTSQENARHAYDNDLQVVKLTRVQRESLIQELTEGGSPTKLARKYNVSLTNIYYYKDLILRSES